MVGSESGQKQSVKFLQNMVYNTIQHPPPLPPTATHCLYCIYCTFSLGRGGGGQREDRGATVHKLGRKYQPMSECIIQCLKSVKHNAANYVNKSILKKSRHIGFGVFIVHSSMTGSHNIWQNSSLKSQFISDKP